MSLSLGLTRGSHSGRSQQVPSHTSLITRTLEENQCSILGGWSYQLINNNNWLHSSDVDGLSASVQLIAESLVRHILPEINEMVIN